MFSRVYSAFSRSAAVYKSRAVIGNLKINQYALSTTYGVTSNHDSLSECVKEELKLERQMIALPKFTHFNTSIDGCLASLTRTYGEEKIEIELNANEPIEIDRETDEEEEELEPFFVPLLSVTVNKPNGDSLIFECSFDVYGDYTKLGDEWDNFTIDSVSVLPKGVTPEAVYNVDTTFLSDKLQNCLHDYLEERGINKDFTSEVVTFYREFEHHSYVSGFLEKLQNFIRN